jgi:hypothetical protein
MKDCAQSHRSILPILQFNIPMTRITVGFSSCPLVEGPASELDGPALSDMCVIRQKPQVYVKKMDVMNRIDVL